MWLCRALLLCDNSAAKSTAWKIKLSSWRRLLEIQEKLLWQVCWRPQEQRSLSFYQKDGVDRCKVKMTTQTEDNHPCHCDRWKLTILKTNVKHMFCDVALREKVAVTRCEFSSAKLYEHWSFGASRLSMRIRLCAIGPGTGQITAGEKVNFTLFQQELWKYVGSSMPNKIGLPVGKWSVRQIWKQCLDRLFKTPCLY